MSQTTSGDGGAGTNRHYLVHRPPLVPDRFVRLPFGSIRPEGWLRRQLEIAADGLARRLLDPLTFDRYLAPCKGTASEVTYQYAVYQEGLITLAGMTRDEVFVHRAAESVEATLAEDPAFLGETQPEREAIIYKRGRQTRGLIEWHELSGDGRIVPWLERFFEAWGESDAVYAWWPEAGTVDLIHVGLWLYDVTGEPRLLETLRRRSRFGEKVADSFLTFPEGEYEKHNVVVAWISRLPAFVFSLTGDERYRRATFEGIERREAWFGQIGGRYTGHEHFTPLERGRRPTNGTELCGVVEYMYSMEKLYAIFGEPELADRLELLAYNSLPGACTADLMFHQYDQQANQVDCSVAKRGFDNSETANLYGIAPHYPCCAYNMHHAWPRLVEHLWMATHDQGLVASAYGPCRLQATVGEGRRVTLIESTDYPFDGLISLMLEMDEPARFPLYLRMPGWAEGAELRYAGGSLRGTAGELVRVERTWRGGDELRLALPMRLRTEERPGGSVALLRGPLYFSLKIGQSYRDLGEEASWEIRPTTPWNYALELRPGDPEVTAEVATSPIGELPFAQHGEPVYRRSAGAVVGPDGLISAYTREPYAGREPVTVRVRGRRVPGWGMDAEFPANAADPPRSPVPSSEPVEELPLVPYGCTRLRVTEFPWVARAIAREEHT